MYFLKKINVTIRALDDTERLIERLAYVMRLVPCDGINDTQIIIFSSDNLSLLRDLGIPDSHQDKEYNILNRITIYENPERTVYHCSIRDFPSLYPTDEVIWHLVSILFSALMMLLSDRTFLVHGALITDGNEHVALVGSSGAGKTTAAMRIPSPFNCEVDDLIAATPVGDGYVFQPFPTWSRLFTDLRSFIPVDSNQQCRIRRFFFIEQANQDNTLPISKAEAVKRLTQSSLQLYMPYWRDLSQADQLTFKSNALMHANNMVETVECRILALSKNGNYWEKIW